MYLAQHAVSSFPLADVKVRLPFHGEALDVVAQQAHRRVCFMVFGSSLPYATALLYYGALQPRKHNGWLCIVRSVHVLELMP